MPNQEKQLTKPWDLEKCINSHSKSWFTYDGPTKLVFLPEKTSFNSNFYIKNVLPVAQRDGMKLIGKDFVYQQDCATYNKN